MERKITERCEPAMPGKIHSAEKILAGLKGFRDHLQEGEQPLLVTPAIWDASDEHGSTACDLVLTNQRLCGYYYVRFPRERLFLDTLALSAIATVSLRKKSFDTLFHEILVSDGQRNVYIRTSRSKSEALYQALRRASETSRPVGESLLLPEQGEEATQESHHTPVYDRQEIRRPFESSPLAITLLFAGGMVLEIAGAFLWIATKSSAAGLPLCFAGLLAVFFAFMVRRQEMR